MKLIARALCPLLAHKPKIQNLLRPCIFGSQPAEGSLDADLRRREAAARRLLTRSIMLETSPQPSGRACDVKEQPSARGRLRATGRYATDLDTRHPAIKRRLRPAGRCATDFPGTFSTTGGRRLRHENHPFR